MDCRDAQALIIPFIEDKLEEEELKGFLAHLETCADCYDELEVYYIVLSGTKQLDHDETDVSDFKGALHEIIKQKNESLRKHRVRDFRINLAIVSIIVIILCAIFFFVGQII